MFDGIDRLILPSRRIEPSLRLYVDAMGFTMVEDDRSPDAGWPTLWGLPTAPTRIVTLAKPNSNGGWIRLVEVPDLDDPAPARRPDRVGPYALDFYLRDPDQAESLIAEHGWGFRSEAVYYKLPGTDLDVRERMLDQTASGLLHALVQYRPRGTRCVIDHDADEDVSEVVAAVFLTDRYTEATAFGRDVLGGQQYFTGRFDGPAVEEMLGLKSGEGFEAALFRGPRSRNARLEFGAALPGGATTSDPVPRVIAGIAVPDLGALHRRIADGTHGEAIGPVTIAGQPHLGLRSRYGAVFDFTQRGTVDFAQ